MPTRTVKGISTLIQLDVSGWGNLGLEYLVLDLNGTVTLDGEVIPGVVERLSALSASVSILLASARRRRSAGSL